MIHAKTTRKRRPLPPNAPDVVERARAFLDTQSEAMRQWSNSALPNRREHETALSHIAALLAKLESEVTP